MSPLTDISTHITVCSWCAYVYDPSTGVHKYPEEDYARDIPRTHGLCPECIPKAKKDLGLDENS